MECSGVPVLGPEHWANLSKLTLKKSAVHADGVDVGVKTLEKGGVGTERGKPRKKHMGGQW